MTHSDFVHLGCLQNFQGLCGVYLALGLLGLFLCTFSVWVTLAHARSTMFHSMMRKLLLHYCSFLSLFHCIRNLFLGGWRIALLYEWLISTLHALIGYYMFILYSRMAYVSISIKWVRITLIGVVTVRLILVITMLAIMQPDSRNFCQNPYWLVSAIVQFILTLCYSIAILYVIRIFDTVSIMKRQKNHQKFLLHMLWSGMLYGVFACLIFNSINLYQKDHDCDTYTNKVSVDLFLRFAFRVSYCVVPVFVTIWTFYRWDTPFRSIDSADLLESSERDETMDHLFWTPTLSVLNKEYSVQSFASVNSAPPSNPS